MRFGDGIILVTVVVVVVEPLTVSRRFLVLTLMVRTKYLFPFCNALVSLLRNDFYELPSPFSCVINVEMTFPPSVIHRRCRYADALIAEAIYIRRCYLEGMCSELFDPINCVQN